MPTLKPGRCAGFFRHRSLRRLLGAACVLAVPFSLSVAGAGAASAATARPALAATAPGTSIGNAGDLTGTASATIYTGSDEWWVIYPRSAGGTVAVTIDDKAGSGTNCGQLGATLYSADGTSQPIDGNGGINPASSAKLSGAAASSDRYYVEIDPDCGSVPNIPYTIKLDSGGGGTAPSPAKASVTPGDGIGNAWPPLAGHALYAQSINFNGGTENWYVLSKKPDSTTATIRIQNTTVDGSTSCAVMTASLYDEAGTSGFIGGVSLNNNQASVLTVPARQAGDPSGLFYLEVTENGDDCGSGGANYTLEPEPAAQFTRPSRVPTAKLVTPAPSLGTPWPPLQGGLSYKSSIAFGGGAEDWYVLYKKPDSHVASITVSNVTVDGSESCAVVNVNLYDNAGYSGSITGTTLNDNQVATLSVPADQAGDPSGVFYLVVSENGDDCGSSGGANLTIDPSPAAEFLSPARPATGHAAAASAYRKAWPPLSGGIGYRGSIDFSGGTQNWYVLDKKYDTKPGTVTVTNTTVDGSTSCAVMSVGLDDSAGPSGGLAGLTLSNNQAGTMTVPGHQPGDAMGLFYVEVTVDGDDCGSGGASYTIDVTPRTEFSSPALKVSSLTLKKAIVGKSYQDAIGVSEGKSPYSFVAKTKLPPGLKLSEKTGVVSGKPTKRGTYQFTVEISDSTKPRHKTVTDVFTITVT
jgi:hypothetical protein